MYNNLDTSGNLDYQEVKNLKDIIDNLKLQILNGIKVRSRVQEASLGEIPSSYLLGKLKSNNKKKLMSKIVAEDNIDDAFIQGDLLDETDKINEYVYKYYKKLYSKGGTNEDLQNEFLNLIDTKLLDEDNDMLTEEITIDEIEKVIETTSNNKSPGIDGIPYEFYKTFWETIKNEIYQIIQGILTYNLSYTQKTAVITLNPKDESTDLLTNWRPTSLTTCDYKIFTKIIANRLKLVIPNVISPEQYCCPDRSIVDCNTIVRDIVNYCSNENVPGAIINLDWSKAFDRVDIEFLKKVMGRLGFSQTFITWIEIAYADIQSTVMVNGILTEAFTVQRGIRQGCPLSMLLYALFQEALYIAFKKNNIIKCIDFPNQEKLIVLGYADDTSLFPKNDESIIEIDNIIKKFENATGAKLNRNKKTKIYGLGSWNDRTNWPLDWLKCDINSFKTLGIIFSNDYTTAINENWNQALSAIQVKIRTIQNRKLSMYQKAIITNCILLSKLWYIAHIYPLPESVSKKINKEIFEYIWGIKNNPVKRNTLTLPKEKGGLGVINIAFKAKSILVNTFMKAFVNPDQITFMMDYYNIIRIGQLFNKPMNMHNVAYNGTVYYNQIVETIRKCVHCPKFPHIDSKTIYTHLVPIKKPRIEYLYDNSIFKWKSIWKNIAFKFIQVNKREIVFKYMHEILPTRKRMSIIEQGCSNVIFVVLKNQISTLHISARSTSL